MRHCRSTSMPSPHWVALVLWATAACLPVAAQSLPKTRAVTTGPLVYRGPTWPAGPRPAPALSYRGAAWPTVAVTTPALVHAGQVTATTALQTPALVYRGPVWPASAVPAPPLVFNGAAAPARQLAPLQPKAPLPSTPSLLKPPPRSP